MQLYATVEATGGPSSKTFCWPTKLDKVILWISVGSMRESIYLKIIGKMVVTPWDGTLNQPHIHLIEWVFIGYMPFWRAPWKVKQLGYHPQGTSIFPILNLSK